MVLIVNILSLVAASSAFALNIEDRRAPADPSDTQYYLNLADNATTSYVTDLKAYEGDSGNLEIDFDVLNEYSYAAGDSCEPPHIQGYFSKKDAHRICEFLNVTLAGHNKKFLATAVANKAKLAKYGYLSNMIDNINSIRGQYQYAFQWMSGACKRDSAACVDAGNIVDAQYATAIDALSS